MRLVFDEMNQAPLDDDVEHASDRELLFAIWSQREIGDLASDAAWAELYRRYPQEPRFLLLSAFEELSQPPIPGVYTADYAVAKARRIADAGGAAIHPLVADLLELAAPRLETTSAADAAALAALQRRVTPASYDAGGAGARLSALAGAVLREYHDRSERGAPLFPPGTAPPSGVPGPERPYRPDTTYVVGDRVRHPTLGAGVVERVLEGKVEVRFADAMRTLVHARRG